MNITCLPVSIFADICAGRMDIAYWAKSAREIGYNGIDISIMFLKNRTPSYINPLKQTLRELGMPIVMMTTYPDFTNPDPVQRQRELEYLVSDVALSSELGIRYLRIVAGQAHPEMPAEEGIAHAVNGFHKIDPYGRRYGVELLYENHAKPGAWDYKDFSFPLNIFQEIFRRTEDTSIGLNFDTGNVTAAGGDPLALLPKVYHRVRTIHVTDMKEPGVFSPTAIGRGIVPNREVFAWLKRRGFSGWLSIEEASGRGLAGIEEAYAFVRDAWEQA